MKKALVALIAIVMVASLSFAQDEVKSVNVVGFNKVTIPANGLALVTPTFESFGEGTLEDLIGDQLPVGSFAWIWDREAKGYVSATRGLFDGWTATTNVILRGDAVWLKAAPGSGEQTVAIMGEVPAAYNGSETTTVHNISTVDAVGYAYPVDVNWADETTLASDLAVGSSIVLWDVDAQGYVSFVKGLFDGWGTEPIIIPAGHAFWVRSSSIIDWEETAPYSL